MKATLDRILTPWWTTLRLLEMTRFKENGKLARPPVGILETDSLPVDPASDFLRSHRLIRDEVRRPDLLHSCMHVDRMSTMALEDIFPPSRSKCPWRCISMSSFRWRWPIRRYVIPAEKPSETVLSRDALNMHVNGITENESRWIVVWNAALLTRLPSFSTFKALYKCCIIIIILFVSGRLVDREPMNILILNSRSVPGMIM